MIDLLAFDHRPMVQDFLTYSICVAALIWGGGPERAVIAVWVLAFELLKIPYQVVWGGDVQLETTDVFRASVDCIAGFLWVAIALNANRNYPLLISALQFLTIGAHLARGLIESIIPVAYAVMIIAPGWLQLLLMAVGLSRHIHRERHYGPYRDWRHPSPWFTWLSYRWRKA